MGRRDETDEEENSLKTTMDDCSHKPRTSFISPIISNISMSSYLTVTMNKSLLSPYLTQRSRYYSLRNLTTVLFLSTILCMVAGDMVYVRSGDFGQLLTSSTARWSKGMAKDPLMLKKPDGTQGAICRVFHTSKIFFVSIIIMLSLCDD